MTSVEAIEWVAERFRESGQPCFRRGIIGGHKLREHTMTLTNNTKRIEELAGAVTILIDNKQYEQAHIAIDELQSKVHALRRHVEHLQNVSDFCARPSGEDTK